MCFHVVSRALPPERVRILTCVLERAWLQKYSQLGVTESTLSDEAGVCHKLAPYSQRFERLPTATTNHFSVAPPLRESGQFLGRTRHFSH